MKNLLLLVLFVLVSSPLLAAGQALETPDSYSSSSVSPQTFVAPEPAAFGAAYEHDGVAPSANWHLAPFSRIGVGTDVSPLGIGIRTAINMNHYFDTRVSSSFFGYTTPEFNISGFNATANIHLASVWTSLDWYPFGSILRLSPGVMFYNGNQVSGATQIKPGTDFSLQNITYYGATANPVTGATPLAGTMKLGLSTNKPAFTVTGGFGSFVPRSGRHWSLPTEFGVAFTGAPTVDVNFSGWACLDARQTRCSNVADTSSQVGKLFNNDLNAQLYKWRRDVSNLVVYPIFSTAVVYSFNIR